MTLESTTGFDVLVHHEMTHLYHIQVNPEMRQMMAEVYMPPYAINKASCIKSCGWKVWRCIGARYSIPERRTKKSWCPRIWPKESRLAGPGSEATCANSSTAHDKKTSTPTCLAGIHAGVSRTERATT